MTIFMAGYLSEGIGCNIQAPTGQNNTILFVCRFCIIISVCFIINPTT